MDKLDTAESRGSAPGNQFQAILDAFQQQRPVNRKSTNDFEKSTEEKKDCEETWRSSLFVSPKKRLQARWEQVSPSLKQTLHRYSPKKLRDYFDENQAFGEDACNMEPCAGGSQILAERQSRYKQIAEFYLREDVPYANYSLSSHEKTEELKNSPYEPVPYEKSEPVDLQTVAVQPELINDNLEVLPFEVEVNVAYKEKDETVDKLNESHLPSQKEDSAASSMPVIHDNSLPSFDAQEKKYPFECAESEISSDWQQEGSACSNDDLNLFTLPKMPVGMPHIILQEPDVPGVPRRPTSLHPPPPEVDLKRKSPVTVQEWVDHLPVKATGSELRTDEPPESSGMLRCQTATRLSREASVQSSSSLDSLLDARKPDPVEVLLNLGFGGMPGIDLDNCRIPKRFLVPSKCKGGDWDEFLRRELLQVQNFECASLGFRGLSGPSHQRPSAIVANIMEKLRERTGPRPPPKTRFTSVARRVLSETSVLSRLSQAHTSSSTTSVLSPDNRKFLESQGKISPEVPRRRIIFGQKSFAIDKDGELVEEETRPHKVSEVSMGSWSPVGSIASDSEDGKPELAPTQEDLLRIRRSSLQRQRKVEEDEVDNNSGTRNRFQPVLEDGDTIRDALVAEIQTLSRKIQSAPAEELVAILEPIKELRVKLNEL